MNTSLKVKKKIVNALRLLVNSKNGEVHDRKRIKNLVKANVNLRKIPLAYQYLVARLYSDLWLN